MKKNTMYTLLLSLVMLLFTHSIYAIAGFKCLQNSHPYGVIATTAILDEMEKQLDSDIPLSKSGKSLVTYSKFRFDVLDEKTIKQSWLIQDILQFSKQASHPMLDIGGGYGLLSKLMLDQHATVILNDLSAEHLLFGRQLATSEQREQLYLNTFKFPRGMIISPNSISGVVLHRVIHFMKPDEVEEGIAKIKRWLIPGGKVFIAVLPPQHGEYRDKVLKQYEKRWQEGEAWPGFGFKSKELLPEQVYALPRYLHVMDERPLEKALLKYGFKIEKKGFIEMSHVTNQKMSDGHELFGIIAVKPNA